MVQARRKLSREKKAQFQMFTRHFDANFKHLNFDIQLLMRNFVALFTQFQR